MDHQSPNTWLIRREVMEGRGLVVLLRETDAAAFALVHEACVVARAEDRLRIVDLSDFGGRRPLTPHHRRIAPADRPDERLSAWIESVDHATHKPFGRHGRRLSPPARSRRRTLPPPDIGGSRGSFDPRGDLPVPDLDLSEAGVGGAVLVVRGESCEAARWLALAAIEAAEAAGKAAPLVLDRANNLGALVGRLGWSAYRASADAPVMGEGGALMRAIRGSPEFEAEWEAASGRLDAELAVDVRDGVRVLAARGRTLLAAAGEDAGGLGPELFLAEATGDGWPEACGLPGGSGADGLLRKAFREGVGSLVRVDGDPVIQGLAPWIRADGGLSLLPHAAGRREGFSAERLGRALGAVCDLARADACAASAQPQILMRWSLRGNAGRRLDFVRTWAGLADLALDGLGAAIDAGRPSLPLVAQALGVGTATARRLVGRPRPPFPLRPQPGQPGGGAAGLGRLLEAFGHDRLPPPGDERAWTGFAECVKLALFPFSETGLDDPGASTIAALLLPLGRDWPARRDRMAAISDDVLQSRDMLRDLVRAARLNGAIPRSELTARVIEATTGGGSIARLAAVSRGWHAHPALARVRRGGVPLDTAWPVPFGTADLGGGWTAVALSTALDLHEEGAAGRDRRGREGLSHCVGGYGRACAEGRSLVLGLRRDGARDSTVELAPAEPGEGDAWDLAGEPHRLVQHRGRENAPASAEAAAALGLLRRALGDGTIPVDPGAIGPRPYGGIVHEPDDPTLLGLWEPLLPGRPPWAADAVPEPDEPDAGPAPGR
jgi:hypothetical protein